MKTLTVLCNAALFGFTCLVLMTDGAPTQAIYILFALLLLLVPIFTVIAVVASAWRTPLGPIAMVCNIVLLAFACWAFIDQYPHPEEEGFVAYLVVVALAPVLSVVWFLWGGHRRLQAGV